MVLSNGHLIVLTYEWPYTAQPNKIEAFISTDGGNSFSKAGIVGAHIGSTQLDKGVGVSVLPTLAADASGGPFNNRIYVVWQDQANGPQSSIMFASSDDEGKTWSAPFQVDDAPVDLTRKYPIVFSPQVAVNKRGVVAVTWFDARSMGDGMGGRLSMAVSSDGGETFSSSVPVASGLASLAPVGAQITFGGIQPAGGNGFSLGTDTRFHVFGNDTQGLAADAAGNFHPVWIDNRTGISQIWSDSIAVNETPIRHGDRSLAPLRDVSSSISFSIANPMYDPKTQTVSGDVSLVNTSKVNIHGPIRFRITRVDSPLGPVVAADSNNGVSGPRALFTFQVSADGSLAPNGHTQPRHLAFVVSSPRQLTSDDVNGDFLPYLTVHFHAYAQ